MRATLTVMLIVLMWVVIGATYYGYLSSNTMALAEAGLIGIVWIGNLIGKMMEEGY